MHRLLTVAVNVVLAAGVAAVIQTTTLGGAQMPAAQAPAPAAAGQPAPPAAAAPIPANEPLGSGPYKAIMEVDPGLKTHTVYRPENLAALGSARLPIVVWGNGACANVGNRFRWFLTEIASYGYLAVAIGPIGPASAEAAPQAAPAPRPPGQPPAVATGQPAPPRPAPQPASRSSQLIDAMNWATAENDRPGSRYYHRLDPSKIAVAGQSCGGVQAIEASADKRTTTTMVFNSGLLPQPSTMAGGKEMSKEDLKALHGPTLYISGDEQDVAFPNANDDFARITAVPVFRGYERGVPHAGTYRESNGGEFGGVAVAWLNWQLKGDRKASLMFAGENCGLCVNPRWVVNRKNLQ